LLMRTMNNRKRVEGQPAPANRPKSNDVKDFLRALVPNNSSNGLLAVSLFSGAGISDYGYLLAGYRFRVQVERDPRRAALGQANFPGSRWLTGDVRQLHDKIVSAFEETSRGRPLALLVATPPCQGMSTSNASRGKRQTEAAKIHEDKNRLALEAAHLCRRLRPFVLVMENVRQIRTLNVSTPTGEQRFLDLIKRAVGDEYLIMDTSLNVADYGIPQNRYRAVIVAVRKDKLQTSKRIGGVPAFWPEATHGTISTLKKHMSIGRWLRLMRYRPLDSSAKEKAKSADPLHFVPVYRRERYRLIADIPPNSGLSAYDNSCCPTCNDPDQPRDRAACMSCGSVLFNRPVINTADGPRLIKGFKSSYRRMLPSQPAPTVTTASGHIGSDTKIHPWENRLLSIKEYADLQTVPRSYDWTPALHPSNGKRLYNVIRDVIGEAFPPYFTYLHGKHIRNLLKVGRRVSCVKSK
jgi:DNA (cytosine-5)-methyltransferase 1